MNERYKKRKRQGEIRFGCHNLSILIFRPYKIGNHNSKLLGKESEPKKQIKLYLNVYWLCT